MKCRRCREPAVIDVRRHNAAFCRDRFLHHCREQVRRGDRRVRDARAGGAGARRGVGRQGLARAVGPPARARLRGRRPLPRARHRRVLRRVRRVRARVRASDAAGRCSRSTCATTTASTSRGAAARPARPVRGVRAVEAPPVQLRRDRRRLRRRRHRPQPRRRGRGAARQRAALGRPGYLGRQHPVLPAAPGFVRKVKPLVRLGERETAAYCVLQGIDYLVEECPMAAGNRHLGYKEVLNALEERRRARRRRSCSGSSSAATSASRADAARGARGPAAVRRCGSPTPGDVCAFCRLRARRRRRSR